jgi:hypothetical protein
MTTDRLGKFYDRLTAKERLPLLLAAEKRGDTAEQQRLSRSAPAIPWRVLDYMPSQIALNTLALIFLTEQLDSCANYWHATWWLAYPDGKPPDDWLFIRETSAYRLCRNAEAWRRFCAEENFDADQLAQGNYSGCMLDYWTAGMAEHAPTRATLIEMFQARGIANPEPVTTETLLEGWRSMWRQLSRDRATR